MSLQNKETLWQGALNCDIYWACLHQKNKKSNKYQFDICNLSGPAIAKLSEHGVTIHSKDDDRGHYVTSKSTFPIRAVDSDGMVIDEETLVGNGSKGRVAVKLTKGTNSFGTFVMVDTQKLQIDELVAFEADGEDIDLNEAEAL